MKNISPIIDALTEPSIPIEGTLLKLKVFAHKVNNEKLIQFINNELNGYENADLPSYRKIVGIIIGTIGNGVYTYPNQSIPILHLDEKIQENLKTNRFNNSIICIEEWANAHDDKTITKLIPIEYYGDLSTELGETYQVQYARVTTSKAELKSIVARVRAMLLDILLAVENTLTEDEIAQLFISKNTEKLEVVNNIIDKSVQNIFNSSDSSEQNIKIQQDIHNNS